jgi:hemoglobin
MTSHEPTPYDLIGGEDAVRRLVDRFYDLMDTLPEVAPLRQMHATNLKVSRQKLFMFMSGWLGGPQLYIEAYGHPRLRARHLPFPIGEAERDQWMLCMSKALEETLPHEPLRQYLEATLASLADHMRNIVPS